MPALHFSSLIDEKLVTLKSPLSDLRDIYTYMVNLICKKYPSDNNENDLVDLLVKRQLNDGILFPCGSAVPHLHIEAFNDTVISVFIPETPIVTDHGIVRIFFMVFTCKSDNSLYLQILNTIIRLSKDTEFYSKILNSQTPREFMKVIKNNDIVVKKRLMVGDIMTTTVLTVKKDTTLKELSQEFYNHNFGYFIVIDDDNQPIGEVTILDYLMAGFPDYTNFLNNLYFLKTFEPFEKLLQEEHRMLVNSIMKPIELSITPDTSIFKTVFLMNKHKRRDVPVLENDKLVGVISFSDIFRKIIRG